MRYYSFDIFDTVVTRVVHKPVDVFLLIQKSLQNENNNLPESIKRSFFSARVWAEFKARRLARKDDVSMSDIYAIFRNDYCLSQHQAQYIANKELETERKCLVPLERTVSRIRDFHKSGQRVIYISDMYLPSEFIKEILTNHGVFGRKDSLYVSGEIGLTKGSGKLFKHVLKKEGIPASSLFHYGDNFHSDFVIPSRMGIHPLLTHLKRTESLQSGRWTKISNLFNYLYMVCKARARLRSSGAL